MTRPLDPWRRLRAVTPASIGLGRSGHALPTAAVLAFAADHAAARDAVHDELDPDLLTAQLGRPALVVDSAAPDRATYLQRPDLGRTLSTQSRATLGPDPHDVTFVLADGLSARAVHECGVGLMTSTIGQLGDITVGMPILARQARVAIGDEIVLLTGAQLVVVLIGERPGLSSASSLSAYTTYAPRPGLPDSRRNCISNVRQDAGLSVAAASAQLARLLRAALEQRVSGIGLHLEPMRSISGPLDTEHGRYRHAGAPTDTRLTRTGSRRGNVESERADAVDLNRHGSTITTRCAFDRFRMWTSPSAQCTSIVMVQPVGCQNSQLRR